VNERVKVNHPWRNWRKTKDDSPSLEGNNAQKIKRIQNVGIMRGERGDDGGEMH
jgi:hypothetical protein